MPKVWPSGALERATCLDDFTTTGQSHVLPAKNPGRTCDDMTRAKMSSCNLADNKSNRNSHLKASGTLLYLDVVIIVDWMSTRGARVTKWRQWAAIAARSS